MAEKIIYAISDSLGETAEAVARATASQYDKEQIEIVRIPYIEDEAQIDEIIADAKNGNHVICHTIVSLELRNYLHEKAAENNIPAVDIMGPVLDAVGTVAGSLTGTSTVTTFVESASGVEAGGRTGLTALTTGIMFLACIFIAPIAGIIPAAATSSALIYVGVLMVAGLKNVDFDDICQALPVALMMIAMPISGSIGHAIGIGLITYTVIKVFTGKAKDVSVLTYVLSLIFLLKFFIVA